MLQRRQSAGMINKCGWNYRSFIFLIICLFYVARVEVRQFKVRAIWTDFYKANQLMLLKVVEITQMSRQDGIFFIFLLCSVENRIIWDKNSILLYEYEHGMKGYSLRLHVSRYLCNGEATAIALRRIDFVNKLDRND